MSHSVKKDLYIFHLEHDSFVTLDIIEDRYKKLKNKYEYENRLEKLTNLEDAHNHLIKHVKKANIYLFFRHKTHRAKRRFKRLFKNKLFTKFDTKNLKALKFLALMVSILGVAGIVTGVTYSVSSVIKKENDSRSIVYTYIRSDNAYKLKVGSKYKEKEITVNPTYKGLKISSFNMVNNKYVETINFSNEIEDIEIFCNNSKSLKEVNLSTSMKEINGYAFSNCISLYKVDLSNIEKVNEFSFSNCFSLKEVSFDNITYFGEASFKGCKAIETVKISKPIEIYQDTFNGATSLNSFEIVDESNLFYIGADILKNTGIYDSIDNSIYEINDWVIFSKGIIYDVTVSKKVADGAFADSAPYIQTLNITNKCTYIGRSAFHSLNLSSIDLPESLEFVGYKAFFDDLNLRTLYLRFHDPRILNNLETPNLWEIFGYYNPNGRLALKITEVFVNPSDLATYRTVLEDNSNKYMQEILKPIIEE